LMMCNATQNITDYWIETVGMKAVSMAK